jgi:RNA polymerase sigma factor (sigma-70 family)
MAVINIIRNINSQELDDIELMSLVIEGDLDKAGLLYEKYKKPLYAYFFKLTGGDTQSSEDLVHTVFYRLIRYRTSFSGGGSFASWLFRIAHNAGIDYNKKNKRRNDYVLEKLSVQTDIYELSDLEKNEQYDTLARAMTRLKHEEREILVLGKIDCLKYSEIAEILGTSESNVRIRIFRALNKLKIIYEKLGNSHYEKTRSERKAI